MNPFGGLDYFLLLVFHPMPPFSMHAYHCASFFNT